MPKEEPKPVQAHDPKLLDKILGMKGPQLETYIRNSQRSWDPNAHTWRKREKRSGVAY